MNKHQNIIDDFRQNIVFDSALDMHILKCNFSELHNHIAAASRPFYISLVHYLASALTVFWKLEIYKTKLNSSEIDWFTYAHTEIEYFFTNLRSALDAFAVILNYNGIKPKQSPESFTKLYYNIDKYAPNHIEAIDELIKSFTEYETIQLIRDEILHRGDIMLVFSGHENGTLFGLIKSSQTLEDQIHKDFYDGKVINFDRYGTYIFCRTFRLFEDFAKMYYSYKKITPSKTSRILGVHGLRVIDQLIDSIEFQ